MRSLTHSLLAPIAALSALAALPAQSHTRTLPKAFTGWYGGTAYTATLARTKFFIQTWFRGDGLRASSPIQQLGWRPPRLAPPQQHTLEIVLANTTATYATLSTTFQNNLGSNPTVFFTLKTVNLPPQNGTADPDTPALWLIGDRPFTFTGPHLLVQVDVQTSPIPATTGYFTDGYELSDPSQALHGVSETGCSGSLVAGYATGNWSLGVAGATANGPVLFLVGSENTLLGGSVPLPLDLTSLGMNGCVLAVDPLVIVPVLANAAGAASLTVPFALGPDSTVVHAQALVATTATPAGFGTTNAAHSILGKDGLSAWLFNFDVFGPVAQWGPFPYSTAEVLLIRP